MDLSSKEMLDASETLPFPTGNKLEVSEQVDTEFLNLVNTYNNEETLKTQKIKILGQLIRKANKLGYIPTNDKNIVNAINKHNLYFSKGGRKDALINFISTLMYNTSADPINLIQGQQPIDPPTDKIKGSSANMPAGIRSKTFNPGSPQSKMTQVLLTLTGKENTGIVASAMKNFEACSQHYSKILNEGTLEQQQRLLINRQIFGHNIKLLANAYVKDRRGVINTEVLNSLDTVNNDEDAFILFSALLSLSTDNAKDPTLSKINAGPKMMSLYTAGLMVGFNVDELIQIMTSRFGWAVTELLQSNVFNDTQGQFSLDGVFNWLQTGPIKEFKALPSDVKKTLRGYAKAFKERASVLKGEDSETRQKMIKEQISDAETVRILKNPAFKLEELLTFKKEKEGEDQAIQNAKKYREELLKELYSATNKDIDPKNEEQQRQKEAATDLYELIRGEGTLTEPVVSAYANVNQFNTDLAKYEYQQKVLQTYEEAVQIKLGVVNENIWDKIGYQDKKRDRVYRFIKAMRKYHHMQAISKKSMVKDSQGNEHRASQVIRQLSMIANEQARLRPVLGLNQGLPNDVQSQLKFLRNFESIFSQRLQEIPGDHSNFIEKLKGVTGRNDARISFEKFVTNENYRNSIIELYDDIKMAVNIFDVMTNVSHYFGYLRSMYALVKTASLSSKVYKEANIISRDVLSKYIDVAKSSTTHGKMTKKIIKFINHKLNTQFLLSKNIVLTIPSGTIYDKYGNEIQAENTEIVLGTPNGNASFKRWFEETFIPELKNNFVSNDFINRLMMVSSNLSWDGMASLNLSLNINMMPISDSERAEFKKYKDSLNNLRSRQYGEHQLIDLMFYYNLIAYNGESTQNSFTSLFEDIFAEKGNNAATDWIRFYSIFDKEGSFKNEIDYTEDELLQYLATNENPESAKMPYIRVYNPDTMAYELAKKQDSKEISNEYEDDYLGMGIFGMEGDPEGNSEGGYQNDSSIGLEERLFNNGYKLVNEGVQEFPRHFTNGYVEASNRVSLSANTSIINGNQIEIKGKIYKEEDLKEIAKKNRHGNIKMSEIIVIITTKKDNGETDTRIDVKQTKYNLDRIFEENNCQ